jgi:predicted MFS family arabinose efflux permease
MSIKSPINTVIKTLIASDFFFFFSLGLLAPLYAVFVLENIDSRIEIIGYAVSIYWMIRLFSTIPISYIMDKIKGHKDEYYFLVFGTFFVSLVPLLLIWADNPLHLFLIQIFNGFSATIAVQAWRILFTSYIDKSMVGFEWALEDVGVCLSTAISASVGAYVVSHFGFNILFFLMFGLGLTGTVILVTLYRVKELFKVPFFKDPNQSSPFKIDSIK